MFFLLPFHFLLSRFFEFIWRMNMVKRTAYSILLVCALMARPLSGEAAAKEKEVISVGELSVGFSENALVPSPDLAGKQLKLYYEGGNVTSYRFIDGESLVWSTAAGEGKEEKGFENYLATQPVEGIYFVDYLVCRGDTTSISIVLDMHRGIATVVEGFLPTEKEALEPIYLKAQLKKPLSGVRTVFTPASIDQPFTSRTPRHAETRDLIGKRIQYIYSSKDAYEHVYLNQHKYTWHCIAGSEVGQADTEYCTYYKIADDLYLFVWQEKVVPTLGVVMLNLKKMKTTGKLFGYEGFEFGRVINFPVGAYAKVLSESTYDLRGMDKAAVNADLPQDRK
jgi:hypothetical protein